MEEETNEDEHKFNEISSMFCDFKQCDLKSISDVKKKNLEIITKKIMRQFIERILIQKNNYFYESFDNYHFKNLHANVLLRCNFEQIIIEINYPNIYSDTSREIDEINLFNHVLIFTLKPSEFDLPDLENDSDITTRKLSLLERKKVREFEEYLFSALCLVYDYSETLIYSRILDQMVDKNSQIKEEEYFLAENFFCHRKEIENCSVCFEKNSVYSICGHNLCRICFTNLKEKKCPLCRYVFID